MVWYDPRTWGKKEEAPTTGEGSMIFKESEKDSAQQAIDSGKNVTIVTPTGKTETYSGGTKTSTGSVSSGTRKTSVTKVVEEEKPLERSPLVKSQAKTTAQFDKPQGTRIETPTMPQGTVSKIETQPYIEKRQTEVYSGIQTGYKPVPFFEFVYVDPTGIGEQKERKATEEEIEFFKTQSGERDLIVGTKKQRFYTEPLDTIKYEYGKISQSAKENVQGLTEFVSPAVTKTVDTFLVPKKAKEFTKGFILGVVEDIEKDPLKNVILFGAAYGAGFVASGASKAVVSVPKIGKQLSVGTKIVTAGAGAYFLGRETYLTGQRIYAEEDYFKKGAILGTTTKDIGISVVGFTRGMKGFQVVEGIWRTRGREFIDIQQGVYPQAPSETHLKLFRENVIPELGEKPGAFHTTGDASFFKGGEFKPIPGTSELPGTYGSTQISTPFSRIPGSASNAELTFTQKISNWWKGLKTPAGEPGVAFLQPEEFRGVKAVKTPGGEFPYSFTQPAKPGFADVPGIKTEIESIFRPEAGGYSFVSGTKYTTIKGVRVPIDVFKYDPNVVVGTIPKIAPILVGGTQTSYSPPSTSQFIAFPTSSLFSNSATDRVTLPSISRVSTELTPTSIKSSTEDSFVSSIAGSSRSRGKSASPTSIAPIIPSPSKSRVSYSTLFGTPSQVKGKKRQDPFNNFSSFSLKPSFKDVLKQPLFKPMTSKGKYAPSLASIGLGITAPKVPSLYSKGAGSLIIRPIISNKSIGGKTSGKKKRSSKGARKSNRRKRS